ncbi:protein angel homolog 2 isoform X1 [Falco biarmicus]|nr:protein angel homolog 2 isoform X1 [Falco peregrinus]XP_014137617.1 protein angel homolog 2 isoform X1 [Falco cherrug]XP_027644262.1 protein angel homolog 2 isoform X1 [Falco peregrinus]XP_040467406.1 protein angel homolog 2 isoform X2 [Falco naumanni]XP_040467410.1 protein angel homolog 2 isoform X2 [Falco naumanni]XP_040467411.1 protein angel homolog 2 isoform X2 [Falco naumanni]XP_055581491.1 protein angel homolog 2 isoform X1 [Falco cherrug]XP_055581492.1 protein angel homolog 2 isofo
MLPRHVQRLGRDWIAHWNGSQILTLNSPVPSCMRWAGHYPWASFPLPVPADFSANWRLPLVFGPWRQFQNSNWQLDNFTQSSCFHLPNPSMKSEGEEPLTKKRRLSGQHDTSAPGEETNFSHQKEALCFSVAQNEEHNNRKGTVRRHWEYFCQHSRTMKIFENKETDQSNTESEAKFDFTVMSYNILSQNLLEDNSHLYKHCRQRLLIWTYRFPNILQEIKQLDADVLCLQEVQEDHYRAEIKSSLESLGYHCEYKMRTGRKPDGCAICFKTSKFSLISSNPVEFFRHDIPLLDRDNVGLVLLLQPRFHCKTNAAICIANTHLLYNPRRGDIKLTQLAMLLAEIASVAPQKDGTFCPIIICGDFNSVPGSPLYRFIKEGKLNYEGLAIGKVSGQEQFPRGQRILPIPIWPKKLGISQNCVYEIKQQQKEENAGEKLKAAKLDNAQEIVMASEKLSSKLQHHFKLSSVYSHYFPETGIPEVTTCHSRSAVTVDYIFYSAANDDTAAQSGAEDSFHGGLKLLGRLALLTEKDLWTVNGLPNENNSSDHLPLLAEFRLIER